MLNFPPGYKLPGAYTQKLIVPTCYLIYMLKTGDSTLLKKNAVTWGKKKRGIPTDISGTVGGDFIVSEDLIVIREDRIVLDGRELL